jgi:hypothetical protein
MAEPGGWCKSARRVFAICEIQDVNNKTVKNLAALSSPGTSKQKNKFELISKKRVLLHRPLFFVSH